MIAAEVGWLGLRVGRHLVLYYICHINRMNSSNDFFITMRKFV